MDVINFISKADGLPDTISPQQRFVVGDAVHTYLAELADTVFDGRAGGIPHHR